MATMMAGVDSALFQDYTLEMRRVYKLACASIYDRMSLCVGDNDVAVLLLVPAYHPST